MLEGGDKGSMVGTQLYCLGLEWDTRPPLKLEVGGVLDWVECEGVFNGRDSL